MTHHAPLLPLPAPPPPLSLSRDPGTRLPTPCTARDTPCMPREPLARPPHARPLLCYMATPKSVTRSYPLPPGFASHQPRVSQGSAQYLWGGWGGSKGPLKQPPPCATMTPLGYLSEFAQLGPARTSPSQATRALSTSWGSQRAHPRVHAPRGTPAPPLQ